MINTVKPQFFPANIRASLQKRKELRALGKEKFIEMTAQMFDVLERAVTLNTSNRGRAADLLNKCSKKRKLPDRAQAQA